MTKIMYRVEPLPGPDNTEAAIVSTSPDGEEWRPIPMFFNSRVKAEEFIDKAVEGMEMIAAYQQKNPPYLYPKRTLN